MSEVIITAIAAGVGAVLVKLGEVIVNIIKAKNEPEIMRLEREDAILGGINELKEGVQSQTTMLQSTQVVEIRHSITSIYYQYRNAKKIPLQMKENLSFLFTEYEKLGGNSYVHALYNEMMEWETE